MQNIFCLIDGEPIKCTVSVPGYFTRKKNNIASVKIWNKLIQTVNVTVWNEAILATLKILREEMWWGKNDINRNK